MTVDGIQYVDFHTVKGAVWVSWFVMVANVGACVSQLRIDTEEMTLEVFHGCSWCLTNIL